MMMLRRGNFLFFFLLLIPLVARASSEQITGAWATHKKDVIVRVESCGNALCGFIDWLSPTIRQTDPQGKPLCHARVMWDFTPDASTVNLWTGGTIYQAAEGKRYDGQIRLENPDKLSLRAYIGAPIMGKTKTLTRVARDSYRPCA